jgi:hypothetical protein
MRHSIGFAVRMSVRLPGWSGSLLGGVPASRTLSLGASCERSDPCPSERTDVRTALALGSRLALGGGR